MDFTMDNMMLWNFVLQMGLVASILLVANILRRKIPFIRRALVPSAVIGGFLALGLRAIDIEIFNVDLFDVALLEMITYHTIAIGFIALSLINPIRKANYSKALIGSKSGALIIGGYLLQAMMGLGITVILAYTIMPDLFKSAGMMLPMGFAQGPGQANNVGATYEALGFVGGQSFALSIAAMGFVVACTFGVIYLNILKRKGVLVRVKSRDMTPENFTVEDFQGENEIPASESIDRFSIQIAFVFLIYLITWVVCSWITRLLNATGNNILLGLIPIIWGFNFIWGSQIAVGFRSLIKLGRKIGWITRQYQNSYLLSRIAGYAFDLMIICAICIIDFRDLSGLWLPFVLVCLAGTFGTLFYHKKMCKILYPEYYYEGFMSMYGMQTGVISSGILLLREIDPKFETPAANNLVLGNSWAIGLGAPMLILIAMAPLSDTLLFTVLGICIVYFIILMSYILFVKPKKRD